MITLILNPEESPSSHSDNLRPRSGNGLPVIPELRVWDRRGIDG